MTDSAKLPLTSSSPSAGQRSGTHVRWRSRVVVGYDPDERAVYLADVLGRNLRIRNATEAIAAVCRRLDMPQTPETLLAHLQSAYPRLSLAAVSRLLDQLLRSGLLITVENVSAEGGVRGDVNDRYDRQLRYFGLFEREDGARAQMQEALARAHVTILGVGGVGSWVARHLAAMGVGRLTLVDHDRVEMSNLNRQTLYTPNDIGQPKVEVAARALRVFNPGITVEPVQVRLNSQADVEAAVKGATMTVLTADKPVVAIREWVSAACARLRQPYIQGSIDAYLLHIGPLYLVPQTGCYDCRRRERMEREADTAATQAAAMMTHPRAHPPLLAPLCGFVGSAIALEVTRFITGFAQAATFGRYLIIDARNWSTTTYDVPHYPDCRMCGPTAETDNIRSEEA